MAELEAERKRKEPRLTSRAKLIVSRVVDTPDVPVEWPSCIASALSKLTAKQRHFAVCVASGMRQVEAYRRAYDVADDRALNGLVSDASQLASSPNVAMSIDLVESWLDRQWLLESKEVLEYGYSRLYEEAENASKSGDRIRAATSLLKAHGAFISRSEVRHIHELDTSSTDALLADLKDVIGLAVPKTPAPLMLADVASVELSPLENE